MNQKSITRAIVLLTFLLQFIVISGSKKNQNNINSFVDSSTPTVSPSPDMNIFYWDELCLSLLKTNGGIYFRFGQRYSPVS